jgi:hypothetical protein
MDPQVIVSIVALLAQFVPSIAKNETLIANAIAILTNVITALVGWGEDIVPEIKNIIAALKAGDAVTPEQLDSLDQLDAQVDASFEDAVAQWQAKQAGSAAPATS